MIGLKRHTVRVVDHQPDWATLAEGACAQIRQAAGYLLLDVQHVGSTAVPSLPAKPILDIAAATDSLNRMPPLVEKLTEIGYIYLGDGGDQGGHLFVWEATPGVRSIHLHVVECGDSQWAEYIRFRDLLCQDAGIRQRYAELKLELGARFADDRKSYTASKHDFIQSTLGMKA
jgi:GrpB-like predicted nucleotidyltransferase (UPF0157 family)